MPEKATKSRAAAKKRRGNKPSTQAGEYVREEMHHVRSGKHGAASAKQAIAIGLSKARKSGVDVPEKGAKKSAKKSSAKKGSSKASSKTGGGAKKTSASSKNSKKKSSGAKKTSARKTGAKKTGSKKTASRKSPVRKTGARKTGARKGQATKRSSAKRPNPRRSAGVKRALRREGGAAASHRALSRQARGAWKQRKAAGEG